MAESELRKRKNIESVGVSHGDQAEKTVRALANSVPKSMQPYLEKSAPFVRQAVEMIEYSIPYIQKAYDKLIELSVTLKPYKLNLLAPAFFGVILCYFGGSFVTLIAAIEAYRIAGWDASVIAADSLYKDLLLVLEADAKDNKKDDDNDGVNDVAKLPAKELLQRKIYIVLSTVDPHKVTNAIVALQLGFMGVVATLRVQFAKAITLGSSIADNIDKVAQQYVCPHLESIMPADFRQWAPFIIRYSVKSVCVSAAWTFQRFLSAVHSSIRGGLMISRNLFQYLAEMEIYKLDMDNSYLDEAIGYGLALLGLYWQLSWGFRLPLILSIFLSPFSVVEYLLMWAVNSK